MKIEDLKPSAEVLSRVDEITTALAACDVNNAALDRIAAEEKTAKEQRDAAVAERADVLAERALETASAKVREFDSKLGKLAKNIAEAEAMVESTAIARTQLEARLSEAEARIQQLRDDGKARQASMMYAGDVARDLYLRIEATVAEHLLPLCLEAAALQAATQSPGLSNWLGDLRIPKLGSVHGALLTGSEAHFGGERVVIGAAWREMQELIEEHGFASQLRMTVEQLGKFTTRKQRLTAAEPYVSRAWTTGNERTLAAAAARTQQEGAAQSSEQAIDRARERAREQAKALGPSNESSEAQRFRLAREGNVAAGVLSDPNFEQFR